jgi:ribose-phosphate pyrophosphokinase
MSIYIAVAGNGSPTCEQVFFETYPDGTFYTKWRPSADGPFNIIFGGTTPGELQQALYLADALRARGYGVRRLIMPFVPGGRQDRVNDEGDFLFTLDSVARDINARGFYEVIVSDAHSSVTTDLIDNCVDICFVNFDFFDKGYDGVIAPDKGAEMRAEDWSFQLGVPAFYASKVRDVETGKLTGFAFPDVPPGDYIVVDDICDGGGTFIGLANEAPEGVNLDLFVTHGLFTKGTADLNKVYNNIYCAFLYNAGPDVDAVRVPLG